MITFVVLFPHYIKELTLPSKAHSDFGLLLQNKGSIKEH